VLDRMLIVGQRQLETVLAGYVAHYKAMWRTTTNIDRMARSARRHRWEPSPCPLQRPAHGSYGWIDSAA